MDQYLVCLKSDLMFLPYFNIRPFNVKKYAGMFTSDIHLISSNEKETAWLHHTCCLTNTLWFFMPTVHVYKL